MNLKNLSQSVCNAKLKLNKFNFYKASYCLIKKFHVINAKNDIILWTVQVTALGVKLILMYFLLIVLELCIKFSM